MKPRLYVIAPDTEPFTDAADRVEEMLRARGLRMLDQEMDELGARFLVEVDIAPPRCGQPTVRITVPGIRTTLPLAPPATSVPGEPRRVEVTFLVDHNTASVIEGGVTGQESYRLRDLLDNRRRHFTDGLVVNAGTPGRWDQLYLPPSSMHQFYRELEEGR